MIKGKKFLSIITTVAMAGSVFGSSFSNSVTVYAKTKDNANHIAASFSTKLPTARLSGNNRYETATKISQAGWTATSEYAIIATGENFPDALCAAPLSKKYNAPIILTESNTLTLDASNELKRLKVSKAFIIGGTGAISSKTESQIKALGITSTRIAGADRYETSEKIAEQLGTPKDVVIATGSNFPDALSIAPIAAMYSMPILLTTPNALPDTIKTYLNKNNTSIAQSYVIGGVGVILDSVKLSLKNPSRLAGDNRYATNEAILENFNSSLNMSNVYLATGENFPDALASSALAPITNSPLVLINNDTTSSSASYINTKIHSIGKFTAVGGTGVISEDFLQDAAADFPNTVITFKDANFENAIRFILNKSTGNLLRKDVMGITNLDLVSMKIKDITGIDNFINLTNLNLGLNMSIPNSNEISDISALKGLTNLQTLDLSYNKISDISTLKKLTNLSSLNLEGNQLSDITALKGLTKLQALYLDKNKIINISALKELTNLQALNLFDNKISDISALKELTNLHLLYLDDNEISDISALKGLTNLNTLNLAGVCGNQISDISALKELTNLTMLGLDSDKITDISVLKGLTKLQTLHLSGDQISDISALNGLTNLNTLYLSGLQICDISALKSLTNLKDVYIHDTQINDINALKNLTNLNMLYLTSNQISDISALKGLVNLKDLNLLGNQISDISALNGLANLQELGLADNQISDITALKGLTNLQKLNLAENKISDSDKIALQNALPNCTIIY